MKKKQINNYMVTVGLEEYTSIDVWATDFDIIKEKDSVYFWNNKQKVAFFELHDIEEIVHFYYDNDGNDVWITLYERKEILC